jgi:hypothetical protein
MQENKIHTSSQRFENIHLSANSCRIQTHVPVRTGTNMGLMMLKDLSVEITLVTLYSTCSDITEPCVPVSQRMR